MPPQPIAYVCVVSDFTLPTLEACLSVQPRQVLLITSSAQAYELAAQRLQALLHEAGMAVDILSQHSTGEKLGGDDIEADAHWLRRHLVPRLEQYRHAGLQCIANLTGGTKSMALGLFTCHPWQRLDYQPMKQPLQAIRHHPETASEGVPFAMLAAPAMQVASPLQVARLYNPHAQQSSLNPLRGNPAALALAQRIWDAQHSGDAALAALWAGLEQLWSEQRDRHRTPTVRLTWQEFFPPDKPVDAALQAGVRGWLEQLQSLLEPAPEPVLDFDAAGITLPGNRPHKQGEHWSRWVSGDWLEQLAYHWLLQAGIPAEAVACNITGGTDDQRSDGWREVDLLVHHKHITSLIEIKADLPRGKTPAELEQQVSSIGERFGKTRKALLLGPQLLATLRQGRRAQSFWLRCRANNVSLLLRPEQLVAFVCEKPIWPRPAEGADKDFIPPEFA